MISKLPKKIPYDAKVKSRSLFDFIENKEDDK